MVRWILFIVSIHALPLSSAQSRSFTARTLAPAKEWLAAGSHIVTVLPKLLEGMIVHPYSKETVQQFLRDARKVEEMAVEGIPVRVVSMDAKKDVPVLPRQPN